MKKSGPIKPPGWAIRILHWYCRPELAEDLEGDLNEYFYRNIKLKGLKRARIIFILDVLKFLRPYTVRKPNFFNLLTQWIMINSYIKISGRIILRNRLFSSINIVGLGISMAIGLLLISMLTDMSKYDRFHEHHEQIYRVISRYKYLEREDPSYYASTSLRVGKAIRESIQGVEKITVLHGGLSGDVKGGEKTVPLSGFWADESLFEVFSFTLSSGDPSTALKNPFTVVITESTAKKLFGDTNALGKTIVCPIQKEKREFIVTGIVQDVPVFSHMRFDILASLSTREITEKENKNEVAWDNIWNAYTYILLPKGTDLKNLQANLDALAIDENKTVRNTTIKLSLQPLTKIALGQEMNNSIGPVMAGSNVWMISVLSFIVILSACFNYTNLSIARSLRRSREVGIRKVVGALRSHVMGQFVVEAVMISLFAFLFSFGLFVLLKPYFLSLNDGYRSMLLLDISPEVVLYFILLAILVGITAGFLPAIFFARVNAIQVLKNIASVGGFRNFTIRKALIIVQFTISLMFITATIIGYKHYKKILASDLGFETENVVNIRLFGNKAELLKKELTEMPEVKGLSASMIITSIGHYYGTTMKYKDPHDSTGVHYNSVDEYYIPLHGHKLIAGRNFTPRPDSVTESEVIVNEKVLKRFNIGNGDPLKALGETLTVDGKPMQIIGVIKDFHYGKSTDPEKKEVIFRYASAKAEFINAKVSVTDWSETFSKIENAWKKIDNVHPLEATFYDEQIAQSYGDFSSRLKVIGSLSFLAICIASIGLLGMVVFTTETRLKEISIRKVLGASEGNLVYMLSKTFLVLLAIATFIALPSTHLFFVKFVLDDYADGASLPWYELMVGVLTVVATAFVMIGSHTLKAARTNPAEVLKNE
jgi:ABC-type antimicrobial peptide transport system permease subunit